MWPGVTAPIGWHLCDGSAGTIDLRNKFIMGAGSSYTPGSVGTGVHAPTGNININGHILTLNEIAGHSHSYEDDAGWPGSARAAFWQEGTGAIYPTAPGPTTRTTGNSSIGKSTADSHSHNASFTGTNITFLPYYIAITYIQKI